MSVYNLAHQLARELANSEERKQYEVARRVIEKDEGATFMLKDFRTRQMELELKAMQGQKPGDEDIAKFRQLAEAVSLHKPVSEFLACEMRLVQVLTDVQKIVNESLGLWDYMSTDKKE